MKWTHKSQIASILVNSDSKTAKLEIWADLKSPLSENWHIRNLENIANKTVKSGEYTFEDLASDISYSTTVTKADAKAVLASIKPFIIKALLAGEVVVLDDLGRLQVTIQSKCFSEDTMGASDFSPAAMVKGHRILFRPEKQLKKEVAAGITLHRMSSEALN